MNRLSVLLVFGGESTEHDISIASAKNVFDAIDTAKYDVCLALIDEKGRWWLVESVEDRSASDPSLQLTVMPGAKRIVTVGGDMLDIDVILPILHGKFGEDGTIQGLAMMAHIPIVGCGVEASAVCMNKDATKRLAAAAGIRVIPGVTVL